MPETKAPIDELREQLALHEAIAKVKSEWPPSQGLIVEPVAQEPESPAPKSKFVETEFWAQLVLVLAIVVGWISDYLPTDAALYAGTASAFGYTVYRQLSKSRSMQANAQRQASIDADTAFAMRVDIEDVGADVDAIDSRLESLETRHAELARRTSADSQSTRAVLSADGGVASSNDPIPSDVHQGTPAGVPLHELNGDGQQSAAPDGP